MVALIKLWKFLQIVMHESNQTNIVCLYTNTVSITFEYENFRTGVVVLLLTYDVL